MKRLIVMLFVIFLVTSLMGCMPIVGEVRTDDITFKYIVIDGMPCVYKPYQQQTALTCDWSMWEGVVIDGEISFPQ